MRKTNWTTIAIVALIAGLLYYFFMQDGCCMKSGKGCKSEVSTSMDVEGEEWEQGNIRQETDMPEEEYFQEEGLDD